MGLLNTIHSSVLHHRPLLRQGHRAEEERRVEQEVVDIFDDASAEGEDPGAAAGQEREAADGAIETQKGA